jgi:uncharacterized membrane protein
VIAKEIMSKRLRSAQPVLAAGLLIGCGLGALFDGIVLHQILQWHNMLSSVRPPLDLVAMKYNMLWDGLFHAAAWVITALGVARLWAAGRAPETQWSNRTWVGALLMGWGLFNLIEGVLDQQSFQLHHVHPGQLERAWDLAFLGWGAAMLVAGLLLQPAFAKSASGHRYVHGRR